jgi:YesN/AraC family two-component response regulator
MERRNIDKAYGKIVFERREEQWTHVQYYAELDILDLIKRGEPEKIPDRIRDMFPSHNGHLSANPHRQAIYEFVACITLVTRFAIEGGAPAEQAYTLSDTYIKYADKTKSAEEVHLLYNKMLIDFAVKVKRTKTAGKPYSFPVLRTMEYIDGNLHCKLSLKEIGRDVGRNPSYLCLLFKKETGIPLSRYINREKIEEARHLLRDTDMSVSAISAALAFGSQSYFAKIFQTFCGETPKEYRQRGIIAHR